MKTSPWLRSLYNLRWRCTAQPFYTDRGITCELTADEIKSAWDRDKAADMPHPRIYRKNPAQGFSKDNIVFKSTLNPI